jgi:hypothetical protein
LRLRGIAYPPSHRIHSCLDAVLHTQLLQDVAQVNLHCVLGSETVSMMILTLSLSPFTCALLSVRA